MGIKGAIIGDIIGSRFEFSKDTMSNNDPILTKDCHYTDDTVMSIACMMACLNNSDFVNQYVNFGNKYPNVGYGFSFKRWLNPEIQFDKEWLDKHPNEPIVNWREPYNSFGNGSAMRVSFVGQYLKNNPVEDVIDLAKRSAEVTHNHEEGIKGAIVTAVCVWMAENGKTKQKIAEYAISQYPKSVYQFGVDRPIEEYIDKMKFYVSCQDSVPFAIKCFLETNSFEECMRLICSVKCDTDTIGAIAGSICESFYKRCFSPKEDMCILKLYLDNELYELIENNVTF